MKVGLTLYGSLTERSGGFRYDRQLVTELRAAGHTVEVLELPWRRYGRGLLDNASLRLSDRLSIDVDVMVQDELAHPSLVYTNRRLPYPVVGVVHHLRASEPRPLAPLYRAVERRYLSTLDGVVCNSTTTRETVAALGVDADRTVVAPPAGDRFDPESTDANTAPEATPDTPLQVVFVGNVAPRKGLDTLVDGLADSGTAAELTVVGGTADPDYLDRVRAQVTARGIEDRVSFAGELSDAELAATLRASHVLAVPSRYEGFGIVYLEAMSFGLPVVASRAGGATDIVTDGENGVLVDPDDPAAVADALARLSADRERLAEMGTAARERYERHPDWTATTDRVRSLLADVTGTEVAA